MNQGFFPPDSFLLDKVDKIGHINTMGNYHPYIVIMLISNYWSRVIYLDGWYMRDVNWCNIKHACPRELFDNYLLIFHFLFI